MDIDGHFHCRSCDHYFSHPADACPICGARCYWMVNPEVVADGALRAGYVKAIVSAMPGPVSAVYLTHDDQLWLPHDFWTHFPEGEPLSGLAWPFSLVMLQADQQGAGVAADAPSAFETQPYQPITRDTVLPVAEEDRQETRERESDPGPLGGDTAPIIIDGPDSVSRAPEVEPKPFAPATGSAEGSGLSDSLASVAEEAAVAAKRSAHKLKGSAGDAPSQNPEPKSPAGFPRHLVAPIAIFLFLVLISLSFLTLRYHRNQEWQRRFQSTTEVSDGNQVLP